MSLTFKSIPYNYIFIWIFVFIVESPIHQRNEHQHPVFISEKLLCISAFDDLCPECLHGSIVY